MRAAAMPPARNTAPIAHAKASLREPASHQASSAPAKVPRAWARKGIRKCRGSNRWMPAARLAGSVTSTPGGGGMSAGPAVTSAMLTTLPTTSPATTAMTLRTQCFMATPPDASPGGQARFYAGGGRGGRPYNGAMDTAALIHAYYAAFNRGDREGMLALLTDDVAHDLNQGARETGREAFRAFMARMDRCYAQAPRDIG